MDNYGSKQPLVTPALDVVGLMNNLYHRNGFDDLDPSMYVHAMYQDQIEDLRFELVSSNQVDQSFFVIGQSGTGKTTALTFLPDERIKERFEVVYVKPGIDPEVDRQDGKEVNVVNVMINIAETLMKVASKKGRPNFVLEAKNRFAELVKRYDGTLSEEILRTGETLEENIEDAANAVIHLFTGFEREKSKRRLMRELFTTRIEDLQNELQSLILSFEIHVAAKRPILMIIDDWEKLRQPESIDNVFRAGIPVIMRLRCRKIISIPVLVATSDFGVQKFSGQSWNFFFKVAPNPREDVHVTAYEADKIKQNAQVFRDIVLSRIDNDLREGMVDEAAFSEAIRLSGGNIRQYVLIMWRAATWSGRKGLSRITRESVDAAAHHIVDPWVFNISSNPPLQIFLERVKRTGTVPEDADPAIFQTLLLDGLLIYNRNGKSCYFPNPLVDFMLKSRQDESA